MAEGARVTVLSQGLFAWVSGHRGRIAGRRLKELAQLGGDTAFSDWASGKLRSVGGLLRRFTEAGWTYYRFTRRGDYYRKRQRRVFGRELPYVSPSTGRPAHPGMKLKEALKYRGPGYNLRRAGSAKAARVVLTLPGARVLNFAARGAASRAARQRYRDEFLQLRGVARAEGDAITARSIELTLAYLREELRTTPAERKTHG